MQRKFSLSFNVPDGMTVEDITRTLGYVVEHFTIGLTPEQRAAIEVPNTTATVWRGSGGIIGSFKVSPIDAAPAPTATGKTPTNMHRIAGAYVVTAQLTNGAWMATFPGFIGEGTTEDAAIADLSARIVAAAREVASLAAGPVAGDPEIVAETPSFGRGDTKDQALVWALSDRAARVFFGVSMTTPVHVVKTAPETEEERARYREGAQLFRVECERRTSEPVSATIGARRPQ